MTNQSWIMLELALLSMVVPYVWKFCGVPFGMWFYCRPAMASASVTSLTVLAGSWGHRHDPPSDNALGLSVARVEIARRRSSTSTDRAVPHWRAHASLGDRRFRVEVELPWLNAQGWLIESSVDGAPTLLP